ncbi:MAG: GGDEF domain-containing protein [Planctomycetota bacterium]|jgi:diguanylate cyclase (GGDEF)-like protein
MTVSKDHPSHSEETDADRLRGILAPGVLSLDLVSALAGDRPLLQAEKNLADALKKSRGPRFFSDLLYSISHQYFALEIAEDLWAAVLRHKLTLSTTLGRNVGIVVATLDYLSNITSNMDAATLVGEVHIGEIVAQSFRDGLTGLFNHTYFYQQIDFEVKRYVRYGALVSMMLMDIDDFKEINDTYGHREGDKILAAMGGTLLREARESDICCRYGGEEFAVILPLTDVHEATVMASRFKKELAERLPGGRTVTLSLGVASCGKSTMSYPHLVEAADTALYRAKKIGKDCVVVALDEVFQDVLEGDYLE